MIYFAMVGIGKRERERGYSENDEKKRSGTLGNVKEKTNDNYIQKRTNLHPNEGFHLV
jgi:hypothetical protein